MFDVILKDQKLPGYAGLLTVSVGVHSLLFTEGNMQVQWSIRLPEDGFRLPGASAFAPLFSGVFNMLPSPQIIGGLNQAFQAAAPGLVAGLNLKTEPVPSKEVSA